MKKLFTIILVLVGVNSFAQLNMTLRSHLPYAGITANIGGIAVNGREYALVGWEFGLSIVDVTNPDSVYQVINIPGAQSEWREVKTFNNYAYITTEANGDGLIIANLNYLPDSAPYHKYFGDAAINNQLQTIHALHIDGGYVYLYGTNLFQGTAVICNLNTNPWNPHYVGNTQGADPNYIHDGYVRNDTLYACHIYTPGYLSIMDVTNKANPVELNTQSTPDQFTHNSWLNDEGTAVFTTDEVPNSYLASYDITDPFNIKMLDKFQTNPGSQSIVHNTHTLNDYEVVSWYTSGVVIVDAMHPDNLIEVGHYDTDTTLSGGTFDGVWGVYPFLPSGNLVVSDINLGLYVLTPTYQRACYLEGVVTDTVTALPINGATVQIVNNIYSKTTNLAGVYKTGIAAAGTYDVTFFKVGYVPKTIYGIQLTNGVIDTLNVQLVPAVVTIISGSVTNAVTGAPISNAPVTITGQGGNYNATSDAAGNFTVNNFYAGNYNVACGTWHYVTYCSSNVGVSNAAPINIQLTPGYYDDFALDFGWINSTTASTGAWVRDVPIGTSGNLGTANPDADVIGDCGNKAYITGNGGGNAGDDDVDGGYVLLTSPSFDLTNYVNPVLYYSRWFYNQAAGGNPPNDSLNVTITNGTQTVALEHVGFNTPGLGTWVNKTYILNNYITPSANMYLTIKVEDIAPGNVTEGGFDKFEIAEGPTTVNEIAAGANGIAVYPNPFNSSTVLQYQLTTNVKASATITDVAGRTVCSYSLSSTKGYLDIGSKLNAGIYFVQLKNADNILQTIKVVKTK